MTSSWQKPSVRCPRGFTRSRHLACVCTTLLMLMGTAACGGDDQDLPNVAAAGPSQLDLAAAVIGEQHSVYGTVTNTLSGNSFMVIDALVSGEPLLVITPDAVPLRTGMRVTVNGTVQQFNGSTASTYGLEDSDLPPFQPGDRFLLADTVDAPVQGTEGS